MNRICLSVATGLLAAALAASPALAHEPEGKEKNQKVIIMTERHDGAGEAHQGKKHHRTHMVIADCAGDKAEFSGDDAAKGQKAKVVICSRGDVSAEDRAKKLESALARINSNDNLSAETKAKITTALRDAIGRLNTAR